MMGEQTGCRHFAATTKEKGATFTRNPFFCLVGWRLCDWFFNCLFLNVIMSKFSIEGTKEGAKILGIFDNLELVFVIYIMYSLA